MAQSVFAVQHVDDDSWRRELCPDCGARLLGLAAWKEHAPHHGWDPTGSPPAFVPVGQGKSFGLTLALWGTNQIPWRWRRLRTRRGSREFPPDSALNLSGAPGLKRTFRACDILSFPAAFK